METSNINVITNLDSDAEDKASGGTGNDITLSELWDGNATTPIDENHYNYQTPFKIYDSLGSTHEISIY